jgi:hypothetical protein
MILQLFIDDKSLIKNCRKNLKFVLFLLKYRVKFFAFTPDRILWVEEV